MEPTQHSPNAPAAESAAQPVAELVVQNGRLSGARRVLANPLTLIGRAEGCEVRLNVEGVSPHHCALVLGPVGLWLHDLRTASGTLVNGEAVASCALHDGDILEVGPFRFRLRVPPELQQPETYSLADEEREALRIQAAAVAAQQAALTEEEIQLGQRRTALEQQEQQLATHLEEKRQRLLALRQEARQEQASAKLERTGFEQRVAEVTGGLTQSRRELMAGQRYLRSERQHLLHLHRRLQQRFHRRWMAERSALRRQAEDLDDQRHELERETGRLQQEKASLTQARLRHNGEIELGRRQLQAGWDKLRQQQEQWQERRVNEQAEWQERLRLVEQREQAAAGAERSLAAERQKWDSTRLQRGKEAEGLENRIRNQRRQLLDSEQEVVRLNGVVSELEQRRLGVQGSSPQESGLRDQESGTTETKPADCVPWILQEQHHAEAQAELQNRLAALATLAGELADQRLYLVEQCERLVRAQHQWQQERQTSAAECETVSLALQERAEALAAREQALVAAECDLGRRREEVDHLRAHLESGQARLAANAATWEGQRDRFVADVRAREELGDRRQAALVTLRHRWDDRRRNLLNRLRKEWQGCEELRQEWAALREDCWQRRTQLEQQERALAVRSLAVEQYRQESINTSPNPKSAEKRLRRLRRRWATLAATAERSLTRERLVVEKDISRLEQRAHQLQKQSDEVAAGEADLASRQAAWEHQELTRDDERGKLLHELQCLRQQRDRYQEEVEKLHDEIERLARLFYDEPASNAPTPPLAACGAL